MRDYLDPSRIQIGGIRCRINTDYWSNQYTVRRSPDETCDLIERLQKEVNRLTIDALFQILEIFRKHPTRRYRYKYPSYVNMDPEIAVDCMKEDFHRGSGYGIHISSDDKLKHVNIYSIFVDEDGIIKVDTDDEPIELGDVILGADEILRFICDAKDKKASNEDDLLYAGVFYSDDTD